MIRDFRSVVVVDIEATCYSDNVFPPGERQEIIEIGVCLLDLRTGMRSRQQSLLVKPVTSTISPFCTSLTGLTQEDLASGLSLTQACAILQAEYKSRNRVWASYGLLDLRLFQTECRLKGVAYPFSAEHLNIQTLFALASPRQRTIGLAGALRVFGIPVEGVAHHGADDAWNAAAILYQCLKGEPLEKAAGSMAATGASGAPTAGAGLSAAVAPPAEFYGQSSVDTAVCLIVDKAIDVFASAEQALAWLASPHTRLSGATPASLMQSPAGRAFVYGALAGMNPHQPEMPGMAALPPFLLNQMASAPAYCPEMTADTFVTALQESASVEQVVRMALFTFGNVPAAIGWFQEDSNAPGEPPARLLATEAGRRQVCAALAAIVDGLLPDSLPEE